MTTIYGKSNHPVFVKKININTWTLRDEIEALIAEKLKALGKTATDDLTDDEINQIKDFYLAREKQGPNNVLQFVRTEEKTAEAVAEELNMAVDAVVEGGAPSTDEATSLADAMSVEDPADEMRKAMEELAGATEAKIQAISNDIPAFNKDTTPFRRKPALLDKSKASPGVLVLSDINMDEILFFSKHEFDFGQSVVIEFLVPNYFILAAEVISCMCYNRRSRIINPARPEYRLKAKFTFQTMGERTLLRNFLKSIAPEVPKHAAKKAAKIEDKDDLSDLGL
ncbi:MAG: hypothetical protein ACOYL6_18615 [Bacteriovoracaceae bacterium]